MPLALPEELKKLVPYIRRAEELDKDKSNAESRLVAYYCRQYAVQTGIRLSKSPESTAALGSILGDLEKEKAAMSAFTREESKYLCSQFADRIFEKANAEDRAGQAGKQTAKTFYSAATLIEILQQFYMEHDDPMELEEDKKKVIYAKWKATEILKALKEGRQPIPGAYNENIDVTEHSPEVSASLGQPPNFDPSSRSEDIPLAFHPTSQSEPVSHRSTMRSAGPVPIIPPVLHEDEGTEVSLHLGPPPAYPGVSAPLQEDTELFAPLPPPVHSPPPDVESSSKNRSPTKKSNSIFGAFTTKKGAATKEMMHDAAELTRFALAALEAKDSELAVTRLQQALKALGS
jgi:vacuolar protein sorting-associated protein VTA1